MSLFQKMFILLFSPLCLFAQEAEDSIETVTIMAFAQQRSTTESTALVHHIDPLRNRSGNKTSLVNDINAIAGVRMEERSPGSYRLNIRGSSLRSPFGVRNVRVYWNNLPLTDASGNTYFNQMAMNSFSRMEIFKGPASSLYGSGTGGLILMSSDVHQNQGATIELNGGSFGSKNLFANAGFHTQKIATLFTLAGNYSNGYREQSAVSRNQASVHFSTKPEHRHSLSFSALYTDLRYETPGALTKGEYDVNPQASRPSTGALPSAIEAKAAIYQKNVSAGLTHTAQWNEHLKHTTTLFFTHADVKNPAIRNYESRNEPGYGLRSSLIHTHKNWQNIVGLEWLSGDYNTKVYTNKMGQPGTLTSNDDTHNDVITYFLQTQWSLKKKLFVNIGSSLGQYQIMVQRKLTDPILNYEKKYQNEWSPRLALRYNMSQSISALASVSRGYAPPTLAEVLPSTGVLNTALQAEYGWNYEVSLQHRSSSSNHNFSQEVTLFAFDLSDAIVQQRDISGADFFENAGAITQRGIEYQCNYSYGNAMHNNGWVKKLDLGLALTIHHLRYDEYKKSGENYDGKVVPSVPSHTIALNADLHFSHQLFLQMQSFYTGRIFLNDANTAAAPPSQLMNIRAGINEVKLAKQKLRFYLGIDNVFNEKYSLGFDINAVNNRFYNAAPTRTFYLGMVWKWDSTQ